MKTSEGFVRADSRNLPKVDVAMLLEYMHDNDVYNSSEIRGAKILMSSRDSYVDTAIGYVEVKREDDICIVKARVTPEHRIRSKMYMVTIKIDEVAESIKEIVCNDCAASVGGCKHGICLTQWLIKRTEEPSVTSVACYWQKPRLSEANVSDHPLQATELGKRRIFQKIYTNITLNGILEECKKQKTTQSLLINYSQYKEETLENYSVFQIMLQFKAQHSDGEACFNSFKTYSEGLITRDIISKIEHATKNQINSVLWHSLRQGRVTASNIFNSTKCMTANGVLVKSIMGGYKVPETRAIQRGRRLEKMVRHEVEKELGVVIRDSGFILVSCIIGASPDGITDDYVIEIKCPSKENTIKNYINSINEVEEKYKSQIMLQMHAANKKKGLFCIADPKFENNKKIIKIWVNYDAEYVANLLQKAENFWKHFIFDNMLELC